jgi:uncharacterized protein YqgV (UPF0045/DUF77 family)
MLVAFSVTPIGAGESVGDAVAEAVRVVRASGLPNRTDAMFTTIEGEWDEVMAVVKRAVDVVAEGPSDALDQLETSLRAGPSGARVDAVDARRGPASGEWHGFEIVRS